MAEAAATVNDVFCLHYLRADTYRIEKCIVLLFSWDSIEHWIGENFSENGLWLHVCASTFRKVSPAFCS